MATSRSSSPTGSFDVPGAMQTVPWESMSWTVTPVKGRGGSEVPPLQYVYRFAR
ncbi:hypothetical protein OKW18_003201 [Streptomyces pratensis]|nr:hypothetical protein [Streptomyces pratensis]